MKDSGASAHPCGTAAMPVTGADAVCGLLERALQLSMPGVATGRLLALDADGTPWVELAESTGAHRVAAVSCVALCARSLGAEVVLATAFGSRRPIIVGVVRTATDLAPKAAIGIAEGNGTGCRIEIDGERLLIEAQSEVVIRCGAASITLTRAGKVLVQGEYVSSRSTGVNRICGGSVEIN